MSLKPNNRPFRILYWIPVLTILGLLSYSCARIVALEGGPKDTTPPQLTKTYPAQEGTEFKGKIIKLVFNKDIEVNDIYNQLVVTPRLPNPNLENKPSYTHSCLLYTSDAADD